MPDFQYSTRPLDDVEYKSYCAALHRRPRYSVRICYDGVCMILVIEGLDRASRRSSRDQRTTGHRMLEIRPRASLVYYHRVRNGGRARKVRTLLTLVGSMLNVSVNRHCIVRGHQRYIVCVVGLTAGRGYGNHIRCTV